MKAVFISRYGSEDVLEYGELAIPQPEPTQLLVKVYASSVNPVDWKIRLGQLQLLTGYSFPMILGFDVAGVVEAVGARVTRFQPGDEIYAYLGTVPGGAYAEYAVVNESAACFKPRNLSYLEAATLPLAGLTALQSLRDLAQVERDNRVLINGASGGVGSLAVQIAKAMGTEVTGVCSTDNVEFVRSLGADRVIDYKQTDFTQETTQYDAVFDAVGARSLWECHKVLKPYGAYVSTLPTPATVIQSTLSTLLPGQTSQIVLTQASGWDLSYLKDLVEANQLRPICDRTYPLSEMVAAHNYSQQGRTVGKIAIQIL
ncbi:NAD(P)-dependent alcohol dehydrogenase [Kamptonema cortianum]|uniref:NAD(P)-dependent alcohol dehydrogenase n=1 Tax=Geitlerinema calcuttense NRMC-F 0142 TaxID=2922238 RepID=A0ABT7LZN2_9CYAN|nr:NAD(P)-dependent alcohol dehydrogenase [Geitlerinema calcuttense]MDK3157402.1 NAD(P)-dependent alcohol dehydrogenase [Kamptonema cortianum]MDL5057032.1 NAD(P)-dependent alcohol dehydrogenase [Geitlerinema calcuttense NRMC-F 0142]